MARMNEHHQKLNEQGVGKCSVPMWMDGMPAGFCDQDAYGFPVKPQTGSSVYVPALACPEHGGPPPHPTGMDAK